jgi:hypothetical protein
MDGGMTGSMKMEEMQGTMHECTETRKNGKMCKHRAFDKCESNMKKGEYQKMMDKAKVQEKKQ